MKKLFRQNSINQKLLTIILAITILSLTVTVAVIYMTTDRGFEKLVTNQQSEIEHTVQTQFDKVAADLQELTEMYASNPEIIATYQTDNRDEMEDSIQTIYSQLEQEHQLNVFELGDTTGAVLLRGHNPEKFGDDKSDLPAIQKALNGDLASGFEFGSSGLSVRAFAPIIDQNEVIGTLQTGVDDSFLDELQNMLQGVTIDLYNNEGEIVVSSDESHVGNTIGNHSWLDTIQNGESVSRQNGGILSSYIPMFDPTNTEIIGMIGISQDISVITDTKEQIVSISLIILAVTVVITAILAIIFSRSISKPIKQAAGYMLEFSKGNLKTDIKDVKRHDEIGKLMECMKTMQSNLVNTMSSVTAASNDVAAHSEELTQAAGEVSSGSEQIARTMEEISSGTESQANAAGELATSMGNFSGKVQDANEKGEQMKQSSLEVTNMVSQGQKMMASSSNQMQKIDDMIRESVTKMNNLATQSKQISNLVSIIDNVADQTNLLALNAAIEAARAGEHGKGFAVVADEVRKLAEQVSTSVGEITQVVDTIQSESQGVSNSLREGYEEVEIGTDQIRTTANTFEDIHAAISKMTENIHVITDTLSTITAESEEMNSTIQEISATAEESAAGIEQTSATAQQSSGSMEEVAGSSEELAKLAERLNELVRRFEV
ncbi:methyl-accepting chemotaxis protein [Oceanobacillus salinisoli]|uniref:methyl-accepting chemotaxis protein n=1 Tax=Oceanobacillus salinisoli TaxID=2678611 RepID=UPI0012E29DE2|nr:methyl-accepting chemotaxis protein [Oceanobacillus salinisoli]